MTVPPGPPPPEPDQPRMHSMDEKRTGAIAATGVIVLAALMVSIGNLTFALVIAPVLALLAVILGSVLTIFERTRRFAVGFLIASAVLLFATAGVCTALFRSMGSA